MTLNFSIDAAEAGGTDEMVALLRESIERYTADNYSFEQRWTALRSARRRIKHRRRAAAGRLNA